METNRDILNIEQSLLVDILYKNGQAHLFQQWPSSGRDDAKKIQLLRELSDFNDWYPGGLESYIDKAQRLLRDSLLGDVPSDGFNNRVFNAEKLELGSDQYMNLESAGIREISRAGFVLVAGGSRRVLGFDGIKASLPVVTVTETSYLKWSIINILALQKSARLRTRKKKLILPLAIMTTEETHKRTLEFLEDHNNFGMVSNQIKVIQQKNVPTIVDSDGSFKLKIPYILDMKPHGNGNVHTILHHHGVVKKWRKYMGTKWVLFFQETNGLAFRGLAAALGIATQNQLVMNSLVNSKYCSFQSGGTSLSTENELFVVDASTYCKVLHDSEGSVPEVVYPEYDTEEEAVFKKPTGLECTLRDYAKLLGQEDMVGVTPAGQFCIMEPVENNIRCARRQQEGTGFASCAATAEFGMYKANRLFLQQAGVKFEPDVTKEYCGISVPHNARVVLEPSFGVTLQEVKNRIYGNVLISAESTLILDGDIDIHNLNLDGALEVRACAGAKVTIRNLTVRNNGWRFKEVDPDDNRIAEKYRIRGYELDKQENEELKFVVPGQYVVDDKTRLKTILIPRATSNSITL